MKKPYSKIVVLFLISSFTLIASAFTVVNVLIPKQFERDAQKTIENELSIMKEASVSEPTYLSDAVQFILPNEIISFSSDINNATYLENYLKLQKLEKKEITEYIIENRPPLNTCLVHLGENGHYLFALLEDYSEDNADPMIIYINIRPFFRYNYIWNIILLALLVSISAVVLTAGSQFNKRFELSHAAEQRFLQNTSHELKTPLMAIQGYAEGIIAGIEDPEKAAKVILEENKRMTNLVAEFLYISRLDSNQLVLQFKTSDIREIIYEAMNLTAPAAHSNHIELLPKMPEQPVFVNCDEEQMIKAISNILSNAVNYATGKVIVTCTADRQKAIISIQDDGEGIDEESLPHIFERFYTTRKGGTGIGLSLASEIVKLQKGELHAQNTDHGALFTIKMPRVKQ
ncbi:MAG: HAMP domain-containing histidine kinase [Solobacterium sp.]|nr:HAMP domain-containing histidine kinase [Solobacterium sp.]